MEWIYFLLCGVFAGTMAGLLGVGGGLVVVPVLLAIFNHLGFPSEVLTQMAIATSLAVMLFTCMGSVHRHHQKGAVDWPLVVNMAIGVSVGAIAGAFLADYMSGRILQILLGVFVLIAAAQTFLSLKPKARKPLPGKAPLAIAGGIMGVISGLFGIGTAIMAVPYLLFHNVLMQKAVATAAACAFPVALFGSIGFIITGLNHHGTLPAHSFGYIYLPAVVSIVVTSVICARFGATLAHKLPAHHLKKMFGVYLVLVGIRLLTAAG
ncbi:Uncharacterised protein [BD1-7 clade bacterium]|uniref:Probable membrane transporter protein n=1 Tax=BD1-7 clade bacterium TaxID=2029982 RepID=A0A5S9P7J1_9GAMM|nr:Uncharacterised protein [BD1-7 clade bacterium]CAA0099492.1 Uncharacterised protein [BD1-7 clade bacterium]